MKHQIIFVVVVVVVVVVESACKLVNSCLSPRCFLSSDQQAASSSKNSQVKDWVSFGLMGI